MYWFVELPATFKIHLTICTSELIACITLILQHCLVQMFCALYYSEYQ